MMKTILLASCFVAACGGDDDDNPPVDSAAGTIMVVDPCPATLGATFETDPLNDSTFMPASATMAVGGVAKFVSTDSHPIAASTGTDAILNVPQGQTKCFKFTAAGTYKFRCTFHGFVGTLTVQ